VQNEPLGDQKFPSCLWSGDQIKEFVQHYLGPLFQEKQLDCGIFLGTLNTADYDNYVFRTLIDQDARRYIAGVGFQWEGKLAIQKAAESWPGLEMLQTENECGDGENSWEYAKYIFELVRHYIRNGVVGYCYWNMILQPSGRSTWGWTQNAMITADPEANSITYNPEFHVMKHYAAYIKPGAVQLELAGPWAGLSLAFENTDGSIAVVVNNPVETELEFDCGILGRCVAATLPAMSFNTIVL
jgi:glucosylceramidase